MAFLKTFKFWAVAGLVIAFMAFWQWDRGQAYDAGYNEAEVKWLTAQDAAIQEAVDKARADWDADAAIAADNIVTETEIVERVRVVEREVPKIVERVVQPECRDLGPDIQRVFNNAITASGANGESDSAESPAALPGT